MKDRYAFERGMLRHMLTTRTREGSPVVWSDTFLRELADDLSTRSTLFCDSPDELARTALSDAPDAGFSSEPLLLGVHVETAYRVMVGAFSYGYHPDWLCVAPSRRLGHPRFPAYDRLGRQVV